MIRTKSTQTLALAGHVPAGKLGQSYRSLVPFLTLCAATAAWGQTSPPTPAATPASAQYRLISIEIPGGNATGYSGKGGWCGINDAGAVTGTYMDASNNSHGFMRRNGTLHILDNPGSVDTALASINNLGVVVGNYGDLTSSQAAMYSFRSGAWSVLPEIPGQPSNVGIGINDSGAAVGWAGVGDFNNNLTNTVSWVWDPTSQSYSFLNVPGAPPYSTYANGINDQGQIAGTFFDTSGAAHGFLKQGETYTTIDVPGATGTYGYGFNNSDTIVGAWLNLSGWNEGFVRKSDGTVTIVNFPGGLATWVFNVNDRGDICGYWVDPKSGLGNPFVGFKQ